MNECAQLGGSLNKAFARLTPARLGNREQGVGESVVVDGLVIQPGIIYGTVEGTDVPVRGLVIEVFHTDDPESETRPVNFVTFSGRLIPVQGQVLESTLESNQVIFWFAEREPDLHLVRFEVLKVYAPLAPAA